MRWSTVIKKYGKEMAKKMKKSQYLRGITLTMYPDGETNIPESDIERAWKDVMGYPIYGWD